MTTCRYRPPLLCRFFLVSYHITRVSMRSNLLLFALLPLPVTFLTAHRLIHPCISLSQPAGGKVGRGLDYCRSLIPVRMQCCLKLQFDDSLLPRQLCQLSELPHVKCWYCLDRRKPICRPGTVRCSTELLCQSRDSARPYSTSQSPP